MHQSTITATVLDDLSSVESLLTRFLPPDRDPVPEIQQPARKRRKVEGEKTRVEAEPPDYWKDHVALAQVDIQLRLPHSRTLDALLNHLPEGRISAAWTGLTNGEDGTYKFDLKELPSDPFAEITVRCAMDSATEQVLSHAVALQKRKSRQAKHTCTMSYSAYPLRHIKLETRIIWRNATSIAESTFPMPDYPLFELLPDCPENRCSDDWTPRDFYQSIFCPEKASRWGLDIQIPSLECQLYPFQKRAIQWLLWRESATIQGRHTMEQDPRPTKPSALPYGFFRDVDLDGRPCFISRWLGIVTTHEEIITRAECYLRGGILAEEMGLGKTVEILGLVCLHRRPLDSSVDVHASIRQSSATLIIAPMSILQQWKTEIRNHAPGIKVKIYDGIKSESIKTGNSEIVSQLLGYDIVLTTYDVLAGEVYYTGVSPERSLRHARKYEWQRSPLVQIDWWRVVLDECQMVESGVSNAAKVAQLIPRQNAWAVSGTPLRNSANDLFGLLIFLRLHPYCNTVQGWISLVTNFKPVFKDLFGAITLRHTKEQVMDDIKLPPHMRKVSTIPFTQIEEEYYSTLFQQMCAECGLNTDGAPLTDTWDPQSSITIDKMRAWLSRLRQSCLHPEVGVRNRRALGRGDAPLRTVPEVLQVMIDQNDTVARTEERALLMSKLRRGQILEHARRSQEALEIWLTVLAQSQTIVVDCRQDVASEEVAVIMPESSQAQSDDAITRRMGMLRLRLRSALEVEHVSTFFVANAYFQLKSDGEVVTPGSDRFKDLEKLEIESYERAKLLRNEILTEAHSKAHALISSIRSPAKGKAFVTIPNMSLENKIGGIESREVLENLEGLSTYLNEQAGQLDEWREKMIELLLLPLVDQEENDLQGDEYETSTKQQDEGYAYIEALRAVVADRHNILSGQNNLLIEKEMGTLLQRAVNDEGHAPELMRTLLRRRIELKPRHQLGSLRSATAELRRMQIALRGQAGGGLRTTTELKIVTDALQTLLLDTKKQSKAITALERELECFRETSNARLEYYRQLQNVSDAVAPYEEDLVGQHLSDRLDDMQRSEDKFQLAIASSKAKGRYLEHLRKDPKESSPQKCIICMDIFEIGLLTTCGHSFCKDCLRHWWRASHNCPVCKKRLRRNDLYQITYKPQELVMREERPSSASETSSEDESHSIYSGINTTTLNEIKNIDLDGSFGTKIDTLARHILWIRENDPGAKSVIFSQFKDFMSILAKAFTKFKIGFSTVDRKDGIERFKKDPSTECFLLHAKAQASGLNLVNATHVFLTEPMINTALELQAIARVHRIGQYHPTTVWMSLVSHTVEKAIYDISVRRRLAHMAAHRKDRSHDHGCDEDDSQHGHGHDAPVPERALEAANSRSLQDAPLARLMAKETGAGELVDQADLWLCLFSAKPLGLKPIGDDVLGEPAEDGMEESAENG